MSTLAANDRLTATVTASAAQTDFPGDFPLLINPDTGEPYGVAVRRERDGEAEVFALGDDFTILSFDDDSFVVRLAEGAEAGDKIQIYGDLPLERGRAHTPGGATRTSTLEGDAMQFTAHLQEARREIGRAVLAPLGEPGLTLSAAGSRNGGLAVFTGGGLSSVFGAPGKFLALDADGNWVPSSGTGADAGLRTDLAGESGGGFVGFRQSGAGAVARSVQEKLRDVVSVRDFGAVGDGVTDDTAAVHAAFDYVKGRRGTVYFPVGTYLVTAGYTQSTAYKDLRILGEGSTREGGGGSLIKFSNADVAVAFYTQNARHHLQVENITFSCAQFVADRGFFVFKFGGATHTFVNVNFESVERPIVYKTGCYFQSATITNVQFRDSGTIHSETSALVGTLLVLDDVHHESAMPANTEKVVCNLQGVRQIQARNFLLEGSGLDATWTVLKLKNDFDAASTRFPIAAFHGFWSEWNNSDPGYSVHQTGGRVVFQGARGLISAIYKYKLDDCAAVEIHNSTFSGTEFDISTQFEFDNYKCQVNLYDCNARKFGASRTHPAFTLINCSEARDAVNGRLIGTNFSNTQSKPLWEFDGGYVDTERLVLALVAGSTAHPSVDATYGRKLVIVPVSGTGVISATFQAKTFAKTVAGQQWSFVYRIKLPTFTGGTIQVRWYDDSVNVGSAISYDSSYSGQEVEGVYSAVDINGGSSLLGFGLSSVSVTGVSGDLEVFNSAIYIGKAAPHTTIPSYPRNIVTFATAAPTAGEWRRGDVVYNSSPSASGKVGWVCTSAGTPGTWKPFGAIDA